MLNKSLVVILISLAVSLFAVEGAAQTRRALVIGNSLYRNSPLQNPVNDAREVSVRLRNVGFSVDTVYNARASEMQSAFDRLAAGTSRGDVVLVYYSGHGLSFRGENYLIPVDASITAVSSLESQAVRLETLLANIETRQATTLLFFDACRVNSLGRSRSLRRAALGGSRIQRGLSSPQLPSGSFIAFSAQPGQPASDGVGSLSPFAEALVPLIERPGLEIRTILQQVRVQVSRGPHSGIAQTPWDHSSLTSDFYFVPPPPPDPCGACGRFAGFWRISRINACLYIEQTCCQLSGRITNPGMPHLLSGSVAGSGAQINIASHRPNGLCNMAGVLNMLDSSHLRMSLTFDCHDGNARTNDVDVLTAGCQ